MKIIFLTVMPSPYIQDLFHAMNKDPRIELQVLYMEQEAPDTYWGEQEMPGYAKVLPGRWIGFRGARIHVNPTIRQELWEHPADLVVIAGYVGLTNQMAMQFLTRQNKPWVFWGEIPGFQQRGWLGTRLRELAQRALKNTSGIAAVGSHAVDAYRQVMQRLQKNEVPIHNIPYHCRLDEFEAVAEKRNHQVDSSHPVRFLYCGQLIERKGVDLLVEAFIRLLREGHSGSLTLAGEGPLRSDLEKSIPEEFQSRILFLGFQPVTELPNVFGEHDVFILPSRHDGWGVVVNQAIAAGMPVIATNAVGAANDLVIPNENGFRIPAGSSDEIYQSMKYFMDSPESITAWRECSRQLAKTITLQAATDAWFQFFQEALQQKPVSLVHS